MDRALALTRDDLLKRLTVKSILDVAYDLEIPVAGLREVMLAKKITVLPPPPPLPDHCVWSPDEDPAFQRLIDQGVAEDDAVNRIEAAVLWALREGYMYIDDDGELVHDYRPGFFDTPVEWQEAA